ncbi:hypothetical protein C8R46DRAFT_1077514 [Mycena filopes]|nr:hypothetical protein C8R46DRAFT_1077514 [Mycena filopes]
MFCACFAISRAASRLLFTILAVSHINAVISTTGLSRLRMGRSQIAPAARVVIVANSRILYSLRDAGERRRCFAGFFRRARCARSSFVRR